MKAVVAGLLLASPAQSAPPPPVEARYLAREQGCRARLDPDTLDSYRQPQPPPSSSPDGVVAELNSGTYRVLADIKKRSPNPLSPQDVSELKAAILSDGAVDAAERDLLEELVQSRVRSITVIEAGQPDHKVVAFPVSGLSRTALSEVLFPPLDLAEEWETGAASYAAIVAYCQKHPEREASVLGFVKQKLAERWRESSPENAYKPLRDRITEVYGWAMACKQDLRLARALLYLAMRKLDEDESDKIPDFLYSYLRPAK